MAGRRRHALSEHALEVFGPNRCMAGSDWPVATLATTVERWFDVIVDVTAQLAEVDQAAVLGAPRDDLRPG